MHDWSSAATLVVAVAAVHQYAFDAAHQSSHKSICEHYRCMIGVMQQRLWLL